MNGALKDYTETLKLSLMTVKKLNCTKIGNILTPVRDYIDSLEVARLLEIPESVINELVRNSEYRQLDFTQKKSILVQMK